MSHYRAQGSGIAAGKSKTSKNLPWYFVHQGASVPPKLTSSCYKDRPAFTRQKKALQEPKPLSLMALAAGLGVLGRQGPR